jgi:hypothetical protein
MKNLYIIRGDDMTRAQVIESIIVAALLAAPFAIYFWNMTP